MIPGRHHDRTPLATTRQRALRDRGDKTGTDDRGFPAARRSDDGKELSLGEPRDELGDENVTAKEVVGVLRLEGLEPLVRAVALDDSARLVRGLQRFGPIERFGRLGVQPEKQARLNELLALEVELLALKRELERLAVADL